MKPNRLLLSIVVSALVSVSAFASTNRPLPMAGRISFAPLFGDVEDYQIGDQWGKVAVTSRDVQNGSAALRRAARATARFSSMFGGATGFYMGKFAGEYVLGTNYHVVKGVECHGATLTFPFLTEGKTIAVKCKREIGRWSDIDFGLVTLNVPPELEKDFEGAGVNFAFDRRIENGTPLLTVGFGIAMNPGQKNMMVNQDSDCKVYSGTDDFRFMADPDTINPGPYRAWSFAHGCDISHGDSGSAFFSRESGEMIGIVWTAATPKDPLIRTRDYLDSLRPTDEAIWTKLGYTVPALKIGEFLKSILPGLEAKDAVIVEEIIR